MRSRLMGMVVVVVVVAGVVIADGSRSGAQDGDRSPYTWVKGGGPPPPEYSLDGDPVDDGTTKTAEKVATPTEHLWNAGFELFGDDFAGVTGFDGEYTIKVKRSPGRVLPESFEGYPVVGVDHSYDELDAAKVRLDVGWEDLRNQFPGVVGWWADPNNDAVTVWYLPEASAAEVADEVAAFHGVVQRIAGDVRIAVDVVEKRPEATANRWYDTPAWTGGARIRGLNAPWPQCSSGFAWINQYGMHMQTTAAHCSLSNNYYWTTLDPSNQYGHQIYNAFFGGPPWHNDTAAMVHYVQPYLGMIYRGGVISNWTAPVQYWYNVPQHNVSGLRTSGATMGEQYVPNGWVYAVNATMLLSPHPAPINGLNLIDGNCEGGDSGGPVFKVGPNGYGIVAAGTITAHWGDWHCWYTPTNVIAARHGGAPKFAY